MRRVHLGFHAVKTDREMCVSIALTRASSHARDYRLLRRSGRRRLRRSLWQPWRRRFSCVSLMAGSRKSTARLLRRGGSRSRQSRKQRTLPSRASAISARASSRLGHRAIAQPIRLSCCLRGWPAGISPREWPTADFLRGSRLADLRDGLRFWMFRHDAGPSRSRTLVQPARLL
jgi:hypothetical protein